MQGFSLNKYERADGGGKLVEEIDSWLPQNCTDIKELWPFIRVSYHLSLLTEEIRHDFLEDLS